MHSTAFRSSVARLSSSIRVEPWWVHIYKAHSPKSQWISRRSCCRSTAINTSARSTRSLRLTLASISCCATPTSRLRPFRGLVHGAIFTRGPQDLQSTAIFIGGSNVAHAEALFERVCRSFMGPFSVSVLLDPNGSNTTAAAAVLAARQELNELADSKWLVLGATGPVGQRVSRLLVQQGAVRGGRIAERRSRSGDM